MWSLPFFCSSALGFAAGLRRSDVKTVNSSRTRTAVLARQVVSVGARLSTNQLTGRGLNRFGIDCCLNYIG